MIDNHNHNNDAEPKSSGAALLKILNDACDDAYEIYRQCEPERCDPILTGWSAGVNTLLMTLLPVHDESPDPAEVATIRALVRAHECDVITVFYPVCICGDDQFDDSEPAFGVIVEVQCKGLTPVKRLLHIDRENPQVTVAKLPVIGRSFGVFYPSFFSEEAA